MIFFVKVIRFSTKLCRIPLVQCTHLSTNLNQFIRSSSTHMVSTKIQAKHSPAENEYYHSFMLRNKKYSNSVAFLDYLQEVKLPDDYSPIFAMNFEETHCSSLMTYLHTILKQSHQAPEILENQKFTELCEAITKKVGELSDDQPLNLLKVLTLWKEPRDDRFFKLCKRIDECLLPYYKIWGFDSLLRGIDHFYRLGVLKYSEFTWCSMKRLLREPKRVSTPQLIHGLFLANALRNWHPAINTYNLGDHLQSCVYEMCTEELAIVALTFFKTQNKIHQKPLMDYMFAKVFGSLSLIDSIPLTSFLKFFRYSCKLHHENSLRSLISMLGSNLDRHSYFCCTHTVLLGTNVLVWNSSTFHTVAKRFVEEISTIRLKDIERTILAFSMFNFEPQLKINVFELAYREIKQRFSEKSEFPREFVSTISYLCLKGYYDFELIDKVLCEEYLSQMLRHKQLTAYNCHPSVVTISNSVRIECPEYSGNLLNSEVLEGFYKNKVWKLFSVNEKRKSACEKVLHEALILIQKVFGGTEFAHFISVVPHLPRADLLLCLKNEELVKLPQHILDSKYLDVSLPSKTEDWLVITFLGLNTTILGTEVPSGNQTTKIRQLKKIGYKVSYLKENEWIDKSEEERIAYLHRLIKKPEVQPPIPVTLLSQ